MTVSRLDLRQTVLVFVDLQERFVPVIDGWESVLQAARILARAAELLEIPVLVTEQYPRGLGRTVPGLIEALGKRYAPVEKLAFSACGATAFCQQLEGLGRRQVLLAGIESHVCVLQTALDLLEAGYVLFPVVDGISSRTAANRRLGLERMSRAGAEPVSVEMALFELLRSAEHPRFREVQALIK